MDFKKFPDRELRNNLTIPFILGMVIPVMILDIFLIIFHHICFRLYKLPLITRKKYVKMDRHKLEYLSFMDKIRCYYCGYANGVFAYAVKIAGDTENIPVMMGGSGDIYILFPLSRKVVMSVY